MILDVTIWCLPAFSITICIILQFLCNLSGGGLIFLYSGARFQFTEFWKPLGENILCTFVNNKELMSDAGIVPYYTLYFFAVWIISIAPWTIWKGKRVFFLLSVGGWGGEGILRLVFQWGCISLTSFQVSSLIISNKKKRSLCWLYFLWFCFFGCCTGGHLLWSRSILRYTFQL